MARTAIVLMVAFSLLCSCATPPKRSPQAQAKAMEANAALDALQPQMDMLLADMVPLLADIRHLHEIPAWKDMERIIESSPTILDYVDGKVDDLPTSTPEMIQWGRMWGLDWDDLFGQYMRLVDRCAVMEARRTALQERYVVVEAKYLGAIAMDVSNGRTKEIEALFKMVDLVEQIRQDLNGYSLDGVGLYGVIPIS